MNYKKIYREMIEKAAGRDLAADIYIEKHHILPKCLGGTNDASNIVKLTAAEHYVAHQLLVKMHPGNSKLIYAVHAMTIGSKKQHIRNNKEYSWIREQFSKTLSKTHKNKIVSQETRIKMSESSKARKNNNNWLGRNHSEKSKQKMSATKKNTGLGVDNNNAHYWKISYPNDEINTIKCLKTLADDLNVSIYRLRNNKVEGYKILNKTRTI